MIDRLKQMISGSMWLGIPVMAGASTGTSADVPYYMADWAFGLSYADFVWTAASFATLWKAFEAIRSFIRWLFPEEKKHRFRIKKRNKK